MLESAIVFQGKPCSIQIARPQGSKSDKRLVSYSKPFKFFSSLYPLGAVHVLEYEGQAYVIDIDKGHIEKTGFSDFLEAKADYLKSRAEALKAEELRV